MKIIAVREDFRRDGLAANFLVTPQTIRLLSEAIPSSKINIGYPGICSAEYRACQSILDSNQNPSAELCITGHARQDHIELMSKLINARPNTSANIWAPLSDYFIKNTLNTEPEQILSNIEGLVRTWQRLSPRPLDIALTDITANEPELATRLRRWTGRLLDAGIRNVILCDTRGIGRPEDMSNLFSAVEQYHQALEFHPHNDNGNALANIREAMRHGITTIGTAVYSAGERKTMVDPTLLAAHGLNIDLDAYRQFLDSYSQDIQHPKAVVDHIFGNGLVITGTQYRLRNRDKSLIPRFGVTSDRYILGRLLEVERDSITELTLEKLKDELLYKRRNIVVDSKQIKEYYKEVADEN